MKLRAYYMLQIVINWWSQGVYYNIIESGLGVVDMHISESK